MNQPTLVFSPEFKESLNGKPQTEILDILEKVICDLNLPNFQGFHLDTHEGTISQIEWLLGEIASNHDALFRNGGGTTYSHYDIQLLCICLEQCLSVFCYSWGDKFQALLMGMKADGINHKTRSGIAKLALELLKAYERSLNTLDGIPF